MNAIIEHKATPTAEFRDQFHKMDSEIGAALPPHIPVERFMRVVLTAVNSSPDLLLADRRSLMESAMKAAQDGLLPDGRDGAFVVFNTKAPGGGWIKKVQWMPMIGGILKKIRNSGDLLSITAHIAHENDTFTYVLGDDEKIIHEPCVGDRGKPRLAYAIAKTKDGGIYREIMNVAEIEAVRAVSRAKESGPWVTWWTEMAKKTVLRRLSKRLPMSSDLDDLIRRDDELYDFKRVGAADDSAARLFRPLRNPLADDEPQEQIEHVVERTDAHDDSGALAPNEAPANGPAVSAKAAEDAQPRQNAQQAAPAPAEPLDRDQTETGAADPLKRAHAEGAAARASNQSRKALPGKYREPGAEALAAAWDDGFAGKAFLS
jgi:recombination protein RecT